MDGAAVGGGMVGVGGATVADGCVSVYVGLGDAVLLGAVVAVEGALVGAWVPVRDIVGSGVSVVDRSTKGLGLNCRTSELTVAFISVGVTVSSREARSIDVLAMTKGSAMQTKPMKTRPPAMRGLQLRVG